MITPKYVAVKMKNYFILLITKNYFLAFQASFYLLYLFTFDKIFPPLFVATFQNIQINISLSVETLNNKKAAVLSLQLRTGQFAIH